MYSFTSCCIIDQGRNTIVHPESDLGNFLLCLNTFKSELIPFQLGTRDFLVMSCTRLHNILSSASLNPEFILGV